MLIHSEIQGLPVSDLPAQINMDVWQWTELMHCSCWDLHLSLYQLSPQFKHLIPIQIAGTPTEVNINRRMSAIPALEDALLNSAMQHNR